MTQKNQHAITLLSVAWDLVTLIYRYGTAQGSMIPGCRNTHSVFHAKAELQCPKPSLVYLRSSECSHQRGMNRTGGACALNRSFGTSQMFLPGIFQLALAHPYHTILFSRPHQLQSATRCVSRSRAQTPRDAVNKCMETRRRRQAASARIILQLYYCNVITAAADLCPTLVFWKSAFVFTT